MENSSNLTSLPEEDSRNAETAPHGVTKLPSAFSSKPDRPPIQTSSQKYAPLDWSDYFDQEDDVCIPDSENVFHIYKAGTEGPVVFCLHGGGYSGLSFALSASKIKEKARVVALDLRGHGKSSTDNDVNLSIETLCNDVLAVLKTMYGDAPPAIVIIGHSMGGAVAVHLAAKKVLPGLSGLVVVDVVEGTALASLIHMQKILSSRMQHFSTIEKAIEWSLKGGSLRNIDSARVSIPGTLTYDVQEVSTLTCATRGVAAVIPTELDWKKPSNFGEADMELLHFRYEGLSEKFLSCPAPKLLLLAGTDRLDRTLTIGQMQGKFQMVVVRHTGHAIQEDVPDEFANLILNFISRNRIGPNGIEEFAVHHEQNLEHWYKEIEVCYGVVTKDWNHCSRSVSSENFEDFVSDYLSY
ncbi:protein phosphatase methylesterase 1 [Sesamum angolense]|uniref:protein phosphatase methylesterase-1 n=1 Tax=Sesamum angolense TaxID=2727404 RepID=A0AAE1WDN0_9LAMI|nr:protein phosphatase methylesterase 1 [Sesamum angolense]